MVRVSLNNRSLLDPRFAYFARPVVRGAMWAGITVSQLNTVDNWEPNSFDSEFDEGFERVPVYVGPARLQPNNDWRARKYRVAGELVSEHAMRIQLDLTGNTIETPYPLSPGMPGDAGLMRADYQVRVDSVFAPYGHPVDGIDKGFTYAVRIVNASSNSWTRVLLCDFIGQHVP